MAIITNPVIGTITGSIGGMTFYTGKSGQTVRQRVTPCLKNTVVLQNAKAKFANAAQQWNNLTSIQKSQWASYATSGYVPLKNVNTGQYSGYNAFVALYNQYTQVLHNRNLCDFFWGTDVAAHNPTLYEFPNNMAPPNHGSIQFNLQGAGNVPIPLFIDGAKTFSTGSIWFYVRMHVSTIIPFYQFFKSNMGDAYTISVYLSEPLTSIDKVPKNPFNSNMGNFGFAQSCATSNWTNNTYVLCKMNCAAEYFRQNAIAIPGQFVRMTFVIVDLFGSALVVYSQNIVVV